MREYIPIIFFIVYLLIQFWGTQKIYSKNLFKYLFIFCLLTPGLSYLIADKDYKLESLISTSIFFWYITTLFVIKKTYKACNTFLVNKKLLKIDYLDKDFTYVNASDDGDLWDEKLAQKPSWFDHVLALLLFIIPACIIILLL